MPTPHSNYPDFSILPSLEGSGNSGSDQNQKSGGIFNSSGHTPGPAESLLSVLFQLVRHSVPHSLPDTCLSVSAYFEFSVATEPLQYLSPRDLLSRLWLQAQALRGPLRF